MKLRERDTGKLLYKHRENFREKLNVKETWVG